MLFLINYISLTCLCMCVYQPETKLPRKWAFIGVEFALATTTTTGKVEDKAKSIWHFVSNAIMWSIFSSSFFKFYYWNLLAKTNIWRRIYGKKASVSKATNLSIYARVCLYIERAQYGIYVEKYLHFLSFFLERKKLFLILYFAYRHEKGFEYENIKFDLIAKKKIPCYE